MNDIVPDLQKILIFLSKSLVFIIKLNTTLYDHVVKLSTLLQLTIMMNNIVPVPLLRSDVINPLFHQTPLHSTKVQAVQVSVVVPAVRASEHVQSVTYPRQWLAVTGFGGIPCGFHDNPFTLEQVEVFNLAAHSASKWESCACFDI